MPIAMTPPAGPALSVNRPCYVNGRADAPMLITGSGWTAGDHVQITGGQQPVTAVVGPGGSFEVAASAPSGKFALQEHSETLTATETDTTGQPVPGAGATTGFLVTQLAFSVSPQDAPFTHRVTFRFSGFPTGREVFAHYLRRRQVVARERLGRATGPCGLLKVRALQYPGGHPGAKRYSVQFDDAFRYSSRTRPRIVAPLSVVRY